MKWEDNLSFNQLVNALVYIGAVEALVEFNFGNTEQSAIELGKFIDSYLAESGEFADNDYAEGMRSIQRQIAAI